MIPTAIRTLMALLLALATLPAVDLKSIAGPGAVLHGQRLVDLHAVWSRLTLADYQKNGVKDPAWDADLTRLLTSVAAIQSDLPVPPGAPSPAEALTLARRLGTPGVCRDPLAAWALFVLLKDDPAELQAAFVAAQVAQAELAFDEKIRHLSRPNNLLQVQVLGWLIGHFGPDVTAQERATAIGYARELVAALTRSLTLDECAGFPALWLSTVDSVELRDRRYGEPVRTGIDALAQVEHLDPWLVDGLRGLVRINNAWAWRGSGWADSVTPEGNAGFERNLNEADDLLTQAWKANPKDPLVPAYACTVAGAGFSKTPLDTWILRSRTACFDHPLATTKAANFLMPRWGGSYEQLLDLGCDCVDTGRFDTSTPMTFTEMLRLGFADAKDRDQGSVFIAALERPRVRAAVDALCTGLAKAHPEDATYFANMRAVYYALQERLPEARRAVEEVPTAKLETAFANYYGVDLRALKAATEAAHQLP